MGIIKGMRSPRMTSAEDSIVFYVCRLFSDVKQVEIKLSDKVP